MQSTQELVTKYFGGTPEEVGENLLINYFL